MTILIKRKATARQIASAKRKLIKKRTGSSGIANYFGALKRGLDGLEYQKEVRNEKLVKAS